MCTCFFNKAAENPTLSSCEVVLDRGHLEVRSRLNYGTTNFKLEVATACGNISRADLAEDVFNLLL